MSGAVIAIVILVVVILLAVGGYFLFKNSKDKEEEEEKKKPTTKTGNVARGSDVSDEVIDEEMDETDPDLLALDPDAVAATAAQGIIGQLPTETGVVANTQEDIANPPTDPDVNCIGEWGPWSECTKACEGGEKTRIYKISTPASGNGDVCTNLDGDTETVECNTDPCPVDCVGEFSGWSDCSQNCGSGLRKRTYKYIRPAEHGGKVCEIDGQMVEEGYEESEPCNTDPCPVACVGSFTEWSGCSKTCGGGKRQRTYNHTTRAAYGGAACPFADKVVQEEACNTQPCPVPCQGAWTAWSDCPRSAQGYRSRTYQISSQAQYGGANCPIAHGTVEGEYCGPGEYWQGVANHNRGLNTVGGVEIMGPKGGQAIPGELEFRAKWKQYNRNCGTWSNRSCTTGVQVFINDQQRVRATRSSKGGGERGTAWTRIKGVKSGDIIKAREEGDRTQDGALGWKFHPYANGNYPSSGVLEVPG